MTSDSELAKKARGVAKCLTYNEEPQGSAKHLLEEMAHRLDTRCIRVHKKKDGYMIINGRGSCRYMTLKETLLYILFNVVPERI